MVSTRALAIIQIVSVGGLARIHGAEPGDFDGDGLITLCDVRVVKDFLFTEPGRFAPGSLDPFEEYPCFQDAPEQFNWQTADFVGGAVFLESIRRSVPGSLPTWSFGHWPESWLEEHPQGPLGVDQRMRVRILDVKAGGSDRMDLELVIELDAPVSAFLLILEGAEESFECPGSHRIILSSVVGALRTSAGLPSLTVFPATEGM